MIYGIPLLLLLLLICRILSICYHHWPDAITYDFEYIHACHFSVFLTIKNILTPPVTGTCRQMINAYKNYIYIALFSASLFLQCHLKFSKKKKKERKEKLLMVIVIVIINILLLVSFLFAYFRLSTPNHILVNQKWNLLLLLVVRMLLFCIFCISSPYSEGWTHFCLHLRVWWAYSVVLALSWFYLIWMCVPGSTPLFTLLSTEKLYAHPMLWKYWVSILRK